MLQPLFHPGPYSPDGFQLMRIGQWALLFPVGNDISCQVRSDSGNKLQFLRTCNINGKWLTEQKGKSRRQGDR